MSDFDTYDTRILRALQHDASQPVEALADRIGLSRNATWRRIKRLEETGVLKARVALVDPEKVGLGLVVFISIRTNRHDADWSGAFARAVSRFPEILGVYRTSGALDYLIRARVADVAAYDALYQRLIAAVDLSDVTASFVMEEIKETTELPV
ncbi:MAG: Lrp/AsnC family transcriptional regulator [Alphaproteobacteria bacterium]|nr:Lrp/AsnC family transcriptional regulator [Alphaproteobacteria bacterium]NNF25045.1 Lrp/AsnC family transcriptional regulator [Paracoccaceae bacterium]